MLDVQALGARTNVGLGLSRDLITLISSSCLWDAVTAGEHVHARPIGA